MGERRSSICTAYPFVQRINSTVHKSIGVSPADKLCLEMLSIYIEALLSIEDKEKFDSEVVMSEYSKDMIARQAEIIAAAQKHQHNVNEQYIATKNKKYKNAEITIFPVNSHVLLGYPISKPKERSTT